MNPLSSILRAIAPRFALRREIARAQLEMLGTYYLGKRDRTTSDWNPAIGSADTEIMGSRTTMVNRARSLTRDNPWARSGKLSFRRKIVGTGITPLPMATQPDGKTELDDFNAEARRLFMDWANDPKACDVEGRRSVWSIQRQIAGEFYEVGEHFIARTYSPSATSLGLRLQCFEPEQLDTIRVTAERGNNEVRDGIEIDNLGRAIAYYFLERPIGDVAASGTSLNSRRIDANLIDHVYEVERVRQTHGVNRLTAVGRKLRDLERYDEATLWSQRMAACIGLIIKRAGVGNAGASGLLPSSGDQNSDDTGNRIANFQPGMVFESGMDEDVQAFTPPAPSAYDPYVTAQLHACGAGIGIGYGSVSMDYTRGTYSGQRQEMLDTYAELDVVQQLIIEQFCLPLWRDFITFAVLEGKLSAPNFAQEYARYTKVEWQGPARPWIDPEKEANAIAKQLSIGVNTRRRVLNSQGHNLRDTFAQLSEEKKLAEEAGIDVSGEPSAPPQPNGNNNPDDSTQPPQPARRSRITNRNAA